ncbi:hypothetical protein [Marivirga sp.]|uniref:hypothetical protein n=1 Tax=Marivirga sp. TaxID=2018662 RepID=UPI002D7E7ADE|nr:hypothetical protein [Marivirga sp.]HET8860463.1 hypothetical protein [Marivirga sp.]
MDAISILKRTLCLSLVLFIVSCQDIEINPDNQSLELNNENIEINDSSVFNMTKFRESFDKVIFLESSHSYKFSHVAENGLLVNSYYGNILYGEFGKKMGDVTHEYNNDGIITSSLIVRHGRPVDSGTRYEYEFDETGKISILYDFYGYNIYRKLKIQYNQNENPKKIEYYLHDRELLYSKQFTYNQDDMLISSSGERYGSQLDYLYEYNDHKMLVQIRGTEVSSTRSVEVEENFIYDHENRLIERTLKDRFDERKTLYEYNEDIMLQKRYRSSGQLSVSSEIGKHFVYQQEQIHFYDNSDIFEGLLNIEFENGLEITGTFYSGTDPENLSQVGFGKIEYDNQADKERIDIFDAQGEFLYYLIYGSGTNNWFLPDGNSIDFADIPEWVKNIFYSM